MYGLILGSAATRPADLRLLLGLVLEHVLNIAIDCCVALVALLSSTLQRPEMFQRISR
jgi:hypothetical protein